MTKPECVSQLDLWISYLYVLLILIHSPNTHVINTSRKANNSFTGTDILPGVGFNPAARRGNRSTVQRLPMVPSREHPQTPTSNSGSAAPSEMPLSVDSIVSSLPTQVVIGAVLTEHSQHPTCWAAKPNFLEQSTGREWPSIPYHTLLHSVVMPIKKPARPTSCITSKATLAGSSENYYPQGSKHLSWLSDAPITNFGLAECIIAKPATAICRPSAYKDQNLVGPVPFYPDPNNSSFSSSTDRLKQFHPRPLPPTHNIRSNVSRFSLPAPVTTVLRPLPRFGWLWSLVR